MQRDNLAVYARYRRLLILLLIFPIYKLIDALVQGDAAMAYIMLASIIVGVIAIIYLETRLKAAQPQPPARKQP